MNTLWKPGIDVSPFLPKDLRSDDIVIPYLRSKGFNITISEWMGSSSNIHIDALMSGELKEAHLITNQAHWVSRWKVIFDRTVPSTPTNTICQLSFSQKSEGVSFWVCGRLYKPKKNLDINDSKFFEKLEAILQKETEEFMRTDLECSSRIDDVSELLEYIEDDNAQQFLDDGSIEWHLKQYLDLLKNLSTLWENGKWTEEWEK